MSRFDPELYLRLLGERELTGTERNRGRWGSPLAGAATALVAVGAIRRSRAEAVLADYGFAEGLRSGEGMHFRLSAGGRRRARRQAKPFEPMRVVPCNATLDDGKVTTTVSYVVLAASRTELAVTIRQAAGGPIRSGPRPPFGAFGGPHTTPQPTLVDDQGTSTPTHFSGGGSDIEWQGQLTAETPLSPDTRWIEVDGQRLELTAEPWPCEVALESLRETTPAHRHLWNLVASAQRFHGPPLESLDVPIDALVAAGVLAPDDAVAAEAQAVAAAMTHHPARPSSAPVSTLPEPWRSLLRRQARGRAGGQEANLVIGAVVAPFDGFRVAMLTVHLHTDHFGVDVDVSPGPQYGPHGEMSLGEPQLEWWAQDDRGNPYLGQFGGWSGSEDRVRADVQFSPALPAKTRWVRIMPTGPTTRAVVTVGLPRAEDTNRAAA